MHSENYKAQPESSQPPLDAILYGQFTKKKGEQLSSRIYTKMGNRVICICRSKNNIHPGVLIQGFIIYSIYWPIRNPYICFSSRFFCYFLTPFWYRYELFFEQIFCLALVTNIFWGMDAPDMLAYWKKPQYVAQLRLWCNYKFNFYFFPFFVNLPLH